jgi:hypothetical protein
MAHLTAGLYFVLAVEMEFGEGIGERLAPFFDVVAEQVLHDRIGMMLDRA